MKNQGFNVVVVLGSTLASSFAFANTGAAINKRTARINYAQGSISRALLVKAALEACRNEAKSPRDCAPVNNNIGICEHVNTTHYNYGAFAAHNTKDGWAGYLACATTTNKAFEFLGTICDHCAKGETIFDETDETSEN